MKRRGNENGGWDGSLGITMTLEEQLERSIYEGRHNFIKFWRWYGKPYKNFHELHSLIEQASLVECLTSPSEYVREYRKWYESRKLDK